MQITGISVVEFAKRENCTRQAIYNAINDGFLKKQPNGKMDPALVGTGWRGKNRNVELASILPDEAAEAAAERLIRASPLMSVADAEKMKENYLALLRKLEYDEKSGNVVKIEDVAAEIGRALAVVRTRLLAIPAEAAPKLHRMKTAREVQDALQEIITRILQELSRGEPEDDDAGV